jgi:hypothetical protein
MNQLLDSDKKNIVSNTSGFYRAKDIIFYCSVKEHAIAVFDEIIGKKRTIKNISKMSLKSSHYNIGNRCF